MKPEAQRIAIAEACGWALWGSCHWLHNGDPKKKEPSGYAPKTKFPTIVPNYPCDLNAMARAVDTLPEDKRIEFTNALVKMFPLGTHMWAQAVNATAAQRAEALLRTLNLWEDEA